MKRHRRIAHLYGWLMVALFAAVLAHPAAAAIEVRSGPERIEIDVSTRSIPVTASFSGTEIIVFGSVENSRQPSAESGYYDVVVVLEGALAPLVARKKSNMGGLWINTSVVRFASLPTYYAIASTRPIDEIAESEVRDYHRIGFRHVPMQVASRGLTSGLTSEQVEGFRNAIVRLKQKERLYKSQDYNVSFIGKSLFRATIGLPANIPVGPLKTRVYLFRDGAMLSRAEVTVNLDRQGVERFLHAFAFDQPLLYGILTVCVAVATALVGSALLRRDVA